MLHPHAPR